MSRLARRVLASLVAAACIGAVAPADALEPAALAGPWQLSFGGTRASCRIQLQAARSDSGEFFLGMPPACRHAMPDLAAAGRWAVIDGAHLVLAAPGGRTLLTLTAVGDGWIAAGPTGTWTLTPASAANVHAHAAPAAPDAVGASPEPSAAIAQPQVEIERISTHPVKVPAGKTSAAKAPAVDAAEVTGRYAVMREKHDTGCMLTLDRTRGKSGDRAQLAPGCRDQGIVIFDPTGWQLAHGALVLTARAGHKTRLDQTGDGTWSKDPKEGGKPLGLKKL